MLKDMIIILSMTLPMLLFSIYPGLRLGDYLEEKYNLQEGQKRAVVIVTTIILTVSLSSLLHYI